MELADILSKELIIPELRAKDRWEAIDELIDHLVSNGKIAAEHREAIVAAIEGPVYDPTTGEFRFGMFSVVDQNQE